MTERVTFDDVDVLLIGAGIMSATVGLLLKELDPALRITVFERLSSVAGESSDARNNAGTGHAALCELNYTAEREDGTIDTRKAVKIMEQFEVSRQFWAYLVERGHVSDPRVFIRSVPHMSFVQGAENVDFLRRRFEALQACPLFDGMRFSDDRVQLAEWMPLVMAARSEGEPVAATWSPRGTDVDFGALTRAMIATLASRPGAGLHLDHSVKGLSREPDGRWRARVQDESVGAEIEYVARFVFIGAGGGALELLDASDIPEGAGYGGFPVSGQWLVCNNPALIARHHAKVYGKAKVGAPPMSVPHLDARYIDGERALLFGPFAGFSTKFLKEGSHLDLPRSITADNLLPMVSAGIRNLPLTRYLIEQVLQGMDERIEALREFIPDARAEDWALEVAGQRVQIIKKDEEEGGRLEFGTEIISAGDNSLAALLGASPGASTSVSIALELLEDCFPERMATDAWRARLTEMIPSFRRKLAEDHALAARVRAWTTARLGLTG